MAADSSERAGQARALLARRQADRLPPPGVDRRPPRHRRCSRTGASSCSLVTSFGDLLPQSHPFVKIHNKYSGTFGGANNIKIMVEVKDGTIFTAGDPRTRSGKMTEELDKVYGVNHNQIDSIAHRTVRYLQGRRRRHHARPAGHDRRCRRPQEEAADIRRIVHNSENIYGLLVSLDDKAALIRANFIEGRSTTSASSPR